MKKSYLHFKVVNAVMNTLRNGQSVSYISTDGLQSWEREDNTCELRKHLLNDFHCVEELDEDELFNDWAFSDETGGGYDFYELTGKSGEHLQISVPADNYATSYDIRDMIAEDNGLDNDRVEITEGMNGYPRHLRGAVLMNQQGITYEDAERMAELYGVEVVSLCRRDGWQLWKSEGRVYEDYDIQAVHASNCDCSTFNSRQDILEYIDSVLRDEDPETDESEWVPQLQSVRDELATKDIDFSHQFIAVFFGAYSDYEVLERKANSYHEDVWTRSLALDCMAF